MNEFPDPGAYITVRTRSGYTTSGFIHENHVFIGNGYLCLSDKSDTENNNVYHYVRIHDIESWTWDCRG